MFTIFASPGILPSMLAVTLDVGVSAPAPALLRNTARQERPTRPQTSARLATTLPTSRRHTRAFMELVLPPQRRVVVQGRDTRAFAVGARFPNVHVLRSLGLASALLVGPSLAVAQQTVNDASISGKVTDVSGGVVAGASVTAQTPADQRHERDRDR